MKQNSLCDFSRSMKLLTMNMEYWLLTIESLDIGDLCAVLKIDKSFMADIFLFCLYLLVYLIVPVRKSKSKLIVIFKNTLQIGNLIGPRLIQRVFLKIIINLFWLFLTGSSIFTSFLGNLYDIFICYLSTFSML